MRPPTMRPPTMRPPTMRPSHNAPSDSNNLSDNRGPNSTNYEPDKQRFPKGNKSKAMLQARNIYMDPDPVYEEPRRPLRVLKQANGGNNSASPMPLYDNDSDLSGYDTYSPPPGLANRHLPTTIHGNGLSSTEDLCTETRRSINSRESSTKKLLLTGLGGNVRMRKVTDDAGES
ncbi:hypothetical protein DL768_009819 [Monosporascus sp. mg162]|nr:hypothetical protein DL768_009819 [Monosporascus sp. mg162]